MRCARGNREEQAVPRASDSAEEAGGVRDWYGVYQVRARGGFRTDEGLNIDQAESITGKPIDIYEKYSEGMRYFALSTQLGHLLVSNEYRALTISVGTSLNRIVPAGWGDNRTAIDEKDSRLKKIYETEGDDYGSPETRGRPFLSGVLDVSYWSKIDDRFSFYVSPFVELSNKHVLAGNYTIYGRNNTFQGNIYKKFQQFGLKIGLFWMIQWQLCVCNEFKILEVE